MWKKASLFVAGTLCALLSVVGCSSSGGVTTPPSAATLAIFTTTLPSGSTASSYSASITATGGTAPYTFSLVSGSLPGGLTLTGAGTLSGTPTGTGTFSFTVAVVDAASRRATALLSVTIIPPVALTTTTLPGGTVGTAYTAVLAASGGTSPYTFTVSAGTLPGGLTLTSAGVLSGTPTAAGSFNFTAKVSDAGGSASTRAFSLVIAALPPLTIAPTSLPGGTVGTAYTSTTLTASNGTAPYTFAVTAGALPAGLTLTSGGVLSGSPTAASTANFTVTATDSKTATGTQPYSVVISAMPKVTITPSSLPSGTAGAAYNQTLTASGGAAPYTFTFSGSLPGGVTLSQTGVLSGTPNGSGTFIFTAIATDANGVTGTQSYTLAINTPAAMITLANLNYGALVNTSYNATLAFAGGTAPYTVSVTSGATPNGITLSSSGVFSGMAAATGSSTFTLHVTDASSPQLSQNFTITLNVVNATVAVDATTPFPAVPSIFYGLHTAVYDNQLTDFATISSRMATDGITMLRYPGGGLSDVYHWAQHSVTPYEASDPNTCNQLSDAYISPAAHFGNFVKLLQTSGAQAVITINYGTSVTDANATRTTGYDGTGTANGYCSNPNQPGQPQEAAAWVAYANGSTTNTYNIGVDAAGFDWKTVGYWASLRAASPLATDDGYNFLRINTPNPIGIKYWEIGNEIYYNGWTQNINAESDIHAPYIYSNGYTYKGYQSRQGVANLSPAAYATYAIPFIQAIKAVDPTAKVGLDYDLPGATDPIDPSYNPSLTQTACSLGSFDFAIIHYYPGTYFGGAKPGELLSLPQFDLPNDIVTGTANFKSIQQLLAQYCSNAANIQLLMTETSPNNSLAPNFPAPVIGLFVLNEMLESQKLGVQNFDWLELHANTGQTNYLDNTFLDSSENPGPSFYGIQLAHLMAAPGDSQVNVTTVPQVTVSTGIVSYATVKADGRKGIVVINADPTNPAAAQVTISGVPVGATATEYSYGISTTQNGTSLTGTSVTIPGSSFPVTVPPYTAVELLIQ